MVRLTGWRGAVVLLVAVAAAIVLIVTVVWVAILLAVAGAVAWLNLALLPRLVARLRVPRLVLDIAALLLLLAAGWLLDGVSGTAVGALSWLVGIGVPRILGWRLRARLGAAGWSASNQVLVASPCPGCGRLGFRGSQGCSACGFERPALRR
jgi:hypothetical protein